MKVVVVGPVDTTSVTARPSGDPAAPRILVRLGPSRLSLNEAEAVDVATKIVGAVESLRAGQPPDQPERPQE